MHNPGQGCQPLESGVSREEPCKGGTQVVAKRRKDRSDKGGGTRLRVGGPRKRTVGYVEEADRTQRSQSGAFRRCSRPGVRNAG